MLFIGLIGALCVGLVGACSTLPTLVPDLAVPHAAPVQITGARGPLPAARSRAILERLDSGSEPTGIFEHHLAREAAITDSPLTSGNSVVLLQDGPATYRAMLAAILAARDHVNMEAYILDDDEVGRRFAEALIAKRREGVQVNLIRDQRGHDRHAGGVLRCADRERRARARVQPGQPDDGARRVGAEPARPPQAADRRWPHRVPGRHQSQ
jgi:cardiolipin synthase